MTKDEAANIVISFESLPKADQSNALKVFFSHLVNNITGTGKERYEKISFTLNLLRSSMQQMQNEQAEPPAQFWEHPPFAPPSDPNLYGHEHH